MIEELPDGAGFYFPDSGYQIHAFNELTKEDAERGSFDLGWYDTTNLPKHAIFTVDSVGKSWRSVLDEDCLSNQMCGMFNFYCPIEFVRERKFQAMAIVARTRSTSSTPSASSATFLGASVSARLT